LVQSLDAAGILSDLTMREDDSSSAAVSRAKSYFLVSAMIGNSLTFAIGPKLLDDEETPDSHHDKANKDPNGQHGAVANQQNDEEQANQEDHNNPTNSTGRTAEDQEEYDNETTSLLPDSVARHASRYREQISEERERQWVKLPKGMQVFLGFMGGFLNAPLIGAVAGAVIGLVPVLHRLFFNSPGEGGYFKAWLTESIQNVGSLFPALQLVVVGAKLSSSITKMKKGEASGSVPWIPMLTISFIRFIMWPA
jgi:auxin efflux carrier family protein